LKPKRLLTDESSWSAVTSVAEERFNPLEVDPEKNHKGVRRKVHKAERNGVKLLDVEDEVDDATKKEIERGLGD
jgi:hypothetical protein